VKLRFATPEDAVGIHAIYAPIVANLPISFEEEPPSIEEIAARIVQLSPGYPWLVAAEDDGAIRGYAYASQHRTRAAYRWSVDVSVYVDDRQQRQGLGRMLYTALLQLLKDQGYRQAFAGIALPNEASVGLHEALGFVLVGVYRQVGWKLGAWHDVGWWQRDQGLPPGEPAEPRALHELDPAEIRAALGSA